MKKSYARGYDDAVKGYDATPPDPVSTYSDERNQQEFDSYLEGYAIGEADYINEFDYCEDF